LLINPSWVQVEPVLDALDIVEWGCGTGLKGMVFIYKSIFALLSEEFE
jgi:hypothetical protein